MKQVVICTVLLLGAMSAAWAQSPAPSFRPLDAQPHEWSAASRNPKAARPDRNGGDDDKKDDDKKDEGPDTENIFGFTTGTDVGDVGEKEAELESTLGLGKRGGSYTALSQKAEFGYTPFRNLHLAAGLLFGYHRIHNVPGLDDRNTFTFEGLSFEARFRLMERDLAPFGLALIIEPKLARIDDTSGRPADEQSIEVKLAADAELAKERLYAAFNVFYEPERTHERGELEPEKESTFGVSSALAWQITKGVFIGAEVRYLRKYDGLGLDRHIGHATFVGPTFYAKLSEHFWIAAAWSVQVAGQSVDNPGLSLDLDNFSRHEARLKAGLDF